MSSVWLRSAARGDFLAFSIAFYVYGYLLLKITGDGWRDTRQGGTRDGRRGGCPGGHTAMASRVVGTRRSPPRVILNSLLDVRADYAITVLKSSERGNSGDLDVQTGTVKVGGVGISVHDHLTTRRLQQAGA